MKTIILLLIPVFASAQSPTLKYHWRKISGPSQYTIVSPLAANTKVTNLVEGVYKFELTVTNRYNLSSKDTMVLTVNAPVKPTNTVMNMAKESYRMH